LSFPTGKQCQETWLADAETKYELRGMIEAHLEPLLKKYVWPLRDRLAATTDAELLQEVADGKWWAELVLDDAVRDLDQIAVRLEYMANDV
jgi:hypothetical protein